jgi:hypothetical protein
MFHDLLSYFLLALTLGSTSARAATPPCKVVPGSKNWPNASTWQSFNKTLGGALLAPLPPAIVCDQSRPATYNKAQCNIIDKQWFNSSLHCDNPVSVDWPNWQHDGCLPSALVKNPTPCVLSDFPYYVVNASTAQHVAAAVKFAGKNNVRLSVKGTGHDLLGRYGKAETDT